MYIKRTWKNGDIIDAEKINHMEDGIDGSITKESFENAGIIETNYTTILSETEATTEDNGYQPKPIGLLSETEKLIFQGKKYRVTIDGETYILPCKRWFIPMKTNGYSKTFVFIGNISYWGDISGYIGNVYNVPFLIADVQDHEDSFDEGLYIFTNNPETVSVKIELVEYTRNQIPAQLVSDSETFPVDMYESRSTYNAYSIGCNSIKNKRGSISIGYDNITDGEFSIAIGSGNNVLNKRSYAIGNANKVSGENAFAFGQEGEAVASYSQAFGWKSKARGVASCAFGYGTEADGQASKTHGTFTKATHRSQFVFGEANAVDPSENAANKRGTYVEIVGNGTGENARSNARTLDWDGNESLAGGLTLGKGTANEATITAAQLKQLLSLLNN